MPLQIRRGTDAQRQSITPAAGEPVWTTDTNTLWVGDGITPGGVEVIGATGGVTEIIAGSNISINQSTGAVTISATGGGGGGPVDALTSGTAILQLEPNGVLSASLPNGDGLDFVANEGGYITIQDWANDTKITAAASTATIQAGGNIWQFNSSGLVFPDNTVQTTAATGSGGSTNTYTTLFANTATVNNQLLFPDVNFNDNGRHAQLDWDGSSEFTLFVNNGSFRINTNGSGDITLSGGDTAVDALRTSYDIYPNINGVGNIGQSGRAFAQSYILTSNVNTLAFADNTLQTTAYLGTATTNQVGGVKVDGTSITINNGVISASGGSASTSSLNISTTWGPTSAQLLESSSFGAYGTATVFRMYDPGGTIFGNIGLVASSAGFSNQPVFTMVNPNGPLVFTANAASSGTYAFTTSGLKFPNGTYQTTAYTGPVSTSTLHNLSYTATLDGSGNFNANMFLASEGNTGNSGYSFQNDGGFDTGMFSTGDGQVQFFANNVEVISFDSGGVNFPQGIHVSGNPINAENGMDTDNLTTKGSGMTINNYNGNIITINEASNPVQLQFNVTATVAQGIIFGDNTVQTTAYTGGGESATTSTLVNGSYTATLDTSGNFNANMFLAAEGPSGSTGYSFQNDGGFDTGMFSTGDGVVQFFANNQEVFNFSASSLQLNKSLDANNQEIDRVNQITFNDTSVQTTAWTGSANIFTATTLVQSAQFQASNGTSQTTGYSFYTETDQATGMYSTGDEDLEFYTDGHLVMQASTSSLNIALPTQEITIANNNGHGGTGYAGILTMTNTTDGATNINKYLRLNSTGDLQIIDSAYANTILSITDAGQVQLGGASAGILFADSTVQTTAYKGVATSSQVGGIALSNQLGLTPINHRAYLPIVAQAGQNLIQTLSSGTTTIGGETVAITNRNFNVNSTLTSHGSGWTINNQSGNMIVATESGGGYPGSVTLLNSQSLNFYDNGVANGGGNTPIVSFQNLGDAATSGFYSFGAVIPSINGFSGTPVEGVAHLYSISATTGSGGILTFDPISFTEISYASVNGVDFSVPIGFSDSTVQTTAYQRVFAQGKLTGGDQSIAQNTDTVLAFNSDIDPGELINGSNQFSPNVAGYYEITVMANFAANATGSDTGQINLQIHLNGSQVAIAQAQINNTQNQTLTASVIVQLDGGSGDYITATAYTSGTTGQTISSGNGTIFIAKKL